MISATRRRLFHGASASAHPALYGVAAAAGMAAFFLSEAVPARTDTAASMLIKQPVESRYQIEKMIGQGGFAKVVAAREKISNTPVAIKRVSKSLTSKAKFVHEVSILKQLQGASHVVQLKDAFETPEDWILVTEYVAGGELFDRLVHTGTYTEHGARVITRDLAETLIDLHALRLVHGDVKPENILLDSNQDGAHMILIDFGLSFHTSEGRYFWDGSGTVAYAAPEVLDQSPNVTTAIDMWAIGVVLFIVLGGYHPFDPSNNLPDAALRKAILRGEFDFDHPAWESISDEAKDLIRRLIVIDPTQRLTAAQVLAHPWLQATSPTP